MISRRSGDLGPSAAAAAGAAAAQEGSAQAGQVSGRRCGGWPGRRRSLPAAPPPKRRSKTSRWGTCRARRALGWPALAPITEQRRSGPQMRLHPGLDRRSPSALDCCDAAASCRARPSRYSAICRSWASLLARTKAWRWRGRCGAGARRVPACSLRGGRSGGLMSCRRHEGASGWALAAAPAALE